MNCAVQRAGLMAAFVLAVAGANAAWAGDKESAAFGSNQAVVVASRDNAQAVLDDKKPKPDKPERPDKKPPTSEVKNLMQDFQKERETYLEQQKALARQYKTATAEERQVLRDQMKEQLDRLKEEQKALREEARERAKELKNELHPDMGRRVDQGTDEGRR